MFNMNMQERKVALVTGSSSGIGFETALFWQEADFIHMLLCVILKNPKI